MVNAAFNLPVYFFAGHHFRDALYQLLGYKYIYESHILNTILNCFQFYCRPSLTGKEVDSPKVQLKNVDNVDTRLESVVKITNNQENNNIAVTQL